MGISYSVIIRTIGTAGEKYERLIASIERQTIPPEETIVVIPHGCELTFHTPTERIVYSDKGMVTQRARGIAECHSEFMLVVDDDVEFGATMVEDLQQFLLVNNLDCCLPLEGNGDGEEKIRYSYSAKSRLRGAFTGQYFYSKKNSQYLDEATLTAGHRVYVNNNDPSKCYPVQLGCFQCFFIKTEVAKAVHFEEDLWLEEGKLSRYANYDDYVFFYKLFLKGYKNAYSLKTRYTHLDATAGRQANDLLESKKIRYYTVARNRTTLWYLYIYKQQKSVLSKLVAMMCGIYGSVNFCIWSTLISLRPKYFTAIKCLFRGYADAIEYIAKY